MLLLALAGVALAQDSKKAALSNNIVPSAGATTLANGNGDILTTGADRGGLALP